VGAQRLRLVAAVIVLGFVFALALGSAGLLGGGRALGSSTTITVIGGDVAVRHGAGASFVAAVDGEVLNPGDAVKTGADARAVLTYFEGSTVTVEPNTELAIDAAAAQGNDTIVQMTQNAGRTWHVVTKLVTGNSKYEVRTPASTASVRGTAFEVDTDGTSTTITTTEGTVIDQVPDPQNPGRTIDVPVPAGQQHSQSRGQGAGQTQPTPEPDRKVTITLSEQNTIVIDTLGRANGFDQNGKRRLETPGAKLEVIDGRLVITLPNVPEGRLQALTRKGGGDVDITTVVTDHGQSSTSNGKLNADANGRADVTVGGGVTNKPNASPSATPTPTATETATPAPAPTQAAGGAGGGNAGNAGGGQGQGGGNTQSGPGQGQGNAGQGQGQGSQNKPSPSSNFVPNVCVSLPTNPGQCPSGTSGATGSSGGNTGGSGGGGSGGSGGGGSGGSGGGGSGGSGGGSGGSGSGGSGSSGNAQPQNDKTPAPKSSR
jgi:hypothetical protein